MKKHTIIWFVVAVIVVAALAVWAGILIASGRSGTQNPDAPSPYSAVYLSTGDIYFGKLSWWPSPHMTDVWYVTRNQAQNGKTQLGLAPMSSVFWGPADEISLNAKDIIFSTQLKNSSQVVQEIENPQSLQNAQQNPSGVSGAVTSTPSVVVSSTTSGK